MAQRITILQCLSIIASNLDESVHIHSRLFGSQNCNLHAQEIDPVNLTSTGPSLWLEVTITASRLLQPRYKLSLEELMNSCMRNAGPGHIFSIEAKSLVLQITRDRLMEAHENTV